MVSDKTSKELVGSVEEALKLGADWVSIHVNLGSDSENEMIRDLGIVSRACMEWGMPLLTMAYCGNSSKDISNCAHPARLAEELGSDIVKIDYPGSADAMENIIKSVRIPVIVAGGIKADNPVKLLRMVDEALAGGAAGVAIGRNIFQYENPEILTGLISGLVHNKLKLQECLDRLQQYERKLY